MTTHVTASAPVPATPRNREERRHSERVERLAYSPAEAAAELGISRAKLYQLLDDGTIPSLKLGRRRLIRREALVSLLANLEAGGAA